MGADTSAVPARVLEAARKRGLGDLVMMRAGANPVGNFVFFVGVAVALAVASGVMLWLASVEVGDLGLYIILCAIGAVVAVVFAFWGLAKGFTAGYVFQQGLIHTHNRSVEVATFAELDEVQQWHGNGLTAGKILGYRVVMFDGRRWWFDGETPKDKSHHLGENLMAMARHVGRPVVYRPRPDYLGPGPQKTPGKIAIFLLLAAVAAVGFGLAQVGFSGWLAATVAFVLVGLILRAVGSRTGLMMRSMGYVFMTIGGLCALGVTIPLLRPLNGWVTAAITIVVEVMLIRLAKISYRGSAYAFGALARRQLTGRRGWAFTSRTTVPVPSPATAVRLLAVANQAISTEGRSVIRKKIDDVEVLVFDRVRAKPVADDRPQTVYYVKLPVRQPFLTPTHLGNAESDTWWVDGDYLISVAVGRGPGGIPNDGIDAMARQLVAFARATDWTVPRASAAPVPPSTQPVVAVPTQPAGPPPTSEQLRHAPDVTFDEAQPGQQ